MVKFLFCDLKSDFTNSILNESKHNNIPYKFKTYVGNIKKIKKKPNIIWISPSNSLGFMDGGIDKVYMEMFPKIQMIVQNKIKQFNKKTLLGRYYLPIGSSILIPLPEQQYLISAPTMFLPQDVSSTKNAYWAMLSILTLLKKSHLLNKNIKVIIPGLCTGYGNMSSQQSAKQIFEAFNDFNKILLNDEVNETDAVICDADNEGQPDYYQNLEIKNIKNT